MEQGSTSWSTDTSDGNGYGNSTLQPKHKVFLSHSGAQKGFVEQLCVDLERCDRHPFFDKRRDCLPIGEDFPSLIFEAIEQCEVGVVVLLEEFFTSKWPMLELVAMANVKKRKPSFTIMPIFLGITFSQCRDVDNHKRWLSSWHTWAERDSRIDVNEWENALQLFGPTNGLKYNFELGEVKFREEIVAAICKLVPSGTRFEDSHVQGRSRLCKVIHEAIKESKVSLLHGVHIVGLYGVGGIGKTTICKAICNDLSMEYHDKVCHVELRSQNEEEVFKEVLGKLTDKTLQYLGVVGADKYKHHLKTNMMNVKVFLTIDNVSSATTNQAWTLLRAKYGVGSVLLVTARTLNELMSLQIDANECMEMPELELEEAKSLFLYHVARVPPTYSNGKDDLDLISSCVGRCHFKKGDGMSYHYHPLALQVLGEQLRCVEFDSTRWRSVLYEIDFLNPCGEPQHPVFSILRTSFDALNPQDQLLFMDVALFAYNGINIIFESFKWSYFKWLGMVHGIPLKDVKARLKNLKRKSLLDNLGDGVSRIGMHDLWREFARLETKVGKSEERQWVYEWEKNNVHGEANLAWGGGLVNVKRMFFDDKGFMKLKYVDFSCFSNVTVLKLDTRNAYVRGLELDLRGLKLLKSLEFQGHADRPIKLISVVGLGSLLELVFLRRVNVPSNSSCIDEMSCLTNLQVLDWRECSRAPNMSKLISLQMASFCSNESMKTIAKFNLKHTNLQLLDLRYCRALKSCSGLGELVALQELSLDHCEKLKELPNLHKVKRLRKLVVDYCFSLQALLGLGDLVSLVELSASCCKSLVELPTMRKLVNLRILNLQNCKLIKSLQGLDDLVSLVELNANCCESLVELPNMCKLVNLRILNLRNCKLIKSLPGLDDLDCLQSLETLGCKNLFQLPNMYKLTNLQTLELDLEAPLQSFTGWSNLISLQSLVVGIDDLHDELHLCNSLVLERLHIFGWQGQGISSLIGLVLLESIILDNCTDVRVLPNFQSLSRLRNLKLKGCEFEDLSALCNLPNLEKLKIIDCDKLEVLPDLQELVGLEELRLEGCTLLRDFRGILKLQNLKSVWARGNPWLHENLGPNLHQLTSLRELHVLNCTNLQWLASCSQIHTLECCGCPIQEFPDLANFPKLSKLIVIDCVNLMNFTCSGPIFPNLEELFIHGCKRLEAFPNLTNSRRMKHLYLANSGVVWSEELTQEIEAHCPSSYSTNKPFWTQSLMRSHKIWH